MTTDGEEQYRPISYDQRLDSLDERLARAQAGEDQRTGRDKAEPDPNSRMANRVLADLIGGIAGGALIGWTVDHFAGTTPWGFIIFLILGVVVAFRNIFRIASAASRAAQHPGSE